MSKILIGNDFWEERRGNKLPVYWQESQVSNHHVGVAGTSGSGKTHWIREFVTGMPDDVEIDIFDYHGDIEIPGASTVMFSEATRYGFNPLVLNTDQHYGGVRRSVNDVIEAINSTSRQLGGNQEGVLRHLLTDTYMLKGIFGNNPRSWVKREASEAEIRDMIEKKNWSGLRDVYPSLDDVIQFARRKLKALWMGIEDKETGRNALGAFDDYCKAQSSLNLLRTKMNRSGGSGNDEELEKMEKKMETSKAKSIESFTTFVNSMDTGREFEEAIKYNSKDVLLSVITRLENLSSTGIFNPNPPPFGNARIRRYILKPLAQSEDELKMFVRFRMRAIIREMMQRGESGGRLRRMIVLDESKKFNSEDGSNPINVIVNEMRKFGLAILLAGQSPAHFSQDFIKNAGTLLLLNLATSDWREAASKLRIEEKDLKYFKPQQTGAVRMLEKGQAAAFRQVSFQQRESRL
ncbi:ATP-binding protein [Pseudomonas chlororaphis]